MNTGMSIYTNNLKETEMNTIASILLVALFVGIVLSILNALGYHIDAETLTRATKSCVEVVYNSGVTELICH
jgi:flagellar biosynthesis protein FliQ